MKTDKMLDKRLRMRRNVFIWSVIGLLLVIGKAVQLTVINQLPSMAPQAAAAMPNPNGYDYYVAAANEIADPIELSVLYVETHAGRIAVSVGSYYPSNPRSSQLIGPLKAGTLGESDLAKIVSDNRAALADIDRALALPTVAPAPRIEYQFNRAGTLELNEIRLVRLLAADAALSEMGQDWSGATCKWLRLLVFSRKCPRPATGYFFGALGKQYACEALFRVLPHLDASRTRDLLAALRLAEIEAPPQREEYLTDKEQTDQALMAMFRDKGWRRAWMRDIEYMESSNMVPVGEPPLVTRARLAVESDRALLHEFDSTTDAIMAQANGRSRPYKETVGGGGMLLAPVGPVWYMNGSRGQLFLDMAELQTALRAYRFDHAGYPASLAALVPRYIQAVPSPPDPDTLYIYTPASGANRLADSYTLTGANSNWPTVEDVVLSPAGDRGNQ